MLGITQLLPGPNSTELAIHIGLRKAGLRGLLCAGATFIGPAVVLSAALGAIYQRYGALPLSQALLRGVKPVLLAVVLQALFKLGRAALRAPIHGVVAAACLVLSFLGASDLVLLLGSGVLLFALGTRKPPGEAGQTTGNPGFFPLGTLVPLATLPVLLPGSLPWILLTFLKIGSVLFGSGYVLISFLRSDLVLATGLLTEGQLLDAIAVGQVTPGPVFSTATFVGYLLHGPAGAALSTLGIFFPAFVLASLALPLGRYVQRSPRAGSFLDGVNAASLALLAGAAAQLARAGVHDWLSLLLFAGAAGLLYRKVNSVWLVLVGGIVGVLFC